MGAVYEVEHTQLGVHYALKAFTLEDGHVVLSDFGISRLFSERLRSEIYG